MRNYALGDRMEGLFYRIKQKRTDVKDTYRVTHHHASEKVLKKVMSHGDSNHIAVVGTPVISPVVKRFVGKRY